MSLKKYSVLMGDIISSREANSEIKLHKDFNDIVSKINRDYANIIISPLTVTLGDEFQGLTKSLSDSFKLANTMRLEFLNRNIKMRFVVGCSFIDSTIVNKKNSWNMVGLGLAEARELLNNKKDKNSYKFHLSNEEEEYILILENMVNTLGESITKIEDKWTKNQLETILESRKHEYNQLELSKKLGKNPASLYRSLKSAQIHLYENQIQSIDSGLKFVDKKNGVH